MSDMTIADDVLRAKADFDAVYAKGQEVGRKAEYDAFWDAVQQNGTRTNYNFGLCGTHWTKKTFRPKYPIRPEGMNNCFAYWYTYISNDLIDFRECCELDTSQATSMSSAFCYSPLIYALGVLDCRSCNSLANAFTDNANLTIIEKIIVKASISYNNAFNNVPALEEIRFEGEIGRDINFQWSTKLSKASIISIINTLSTTTSGLTVTLSKTAVDVAFYDEADGGRLGSETQEWETLAQSKSNWTISLA
jgi:hypothetical protein